MNELVKPELNMDLDIRLPDIPPITHNLNVIENWVTDLDNFYDKLVFNEEQYREATAERTKVNKLKKTIEDNRKSIISQYKKPIDDFESTSKRIEKALGNVSSKLGQKIEVFDLKEKKIKEEKINKFVEEIRETFTQSYVEYAKHLNELYICFDDRWFNKTYKDKDIKEDITTQFNEKVDDLDAFKRDAETLVNYFNAINKDGVLTKDKYIERYKYTRDVNLVMSDIKKDYDEATTKKVEVVKEIVEEVDPFAGLSVFEEETKLTFSVVCPQSKVELFKKFALENNIELKEMK